MSYVAMDWAMPKVIADVNAKSCLAVLAFHHNKDTGLCCPSIATIAAEMGVKSRVTVRKSIKALEDMGLLKSSRVLSERGEIIRTEYFLNLESREFIPEKEASDVGHDVTEGHSVKADHVVTEGHDMTDGGSSHNPPVDHVVNGVGHDVTPNKEYNKEEEQVNKQELHPTDNVRVSKETLHMSDEQALDCLFPVDESLIREAQTVVEDQAHKQTKTTKKRNTHEMPPAKPEGVSDQVWKDWVVYKKKKSKTVNQYMVEKMVRESQKANISLEDFLKLHMASGWVDYKAEYVKPEDRTGLKPNDPSSIDEWTRKNLGKKVNGQTVLLTQEQRIAENNWGFY